jgi:AcrR family transcriptional regulator
MNTRRVTQNGDRVKRVYRSDRRAQQARQTRKLIVEAGARLFVERGYGATTVDAVAEAAGVSRKTVFTAVGGKLELLKTALDWAVAGDDRPTALSDRDEMQQLLALEDAAALIRGWVAMLVAIDRRVAPLMKALDVAAGADADAQALVHRSQRQRTAAARTIVGRLIALDALDSGLERDQAVDIAWLATDAVLYERLVHIRGWSQRRFESWLANSLCRQLLGG